MRGQRSGEQNFALAIMVRVICALVVGLSGVGLRTTMGGLCHLGARVIVSSGVSVSGGGFGLAPDAKRL